MLSCWLVCLHCGQEVYRKRRVKKKYKNMKFFTVMCDYDMLTTFDPVFPP